MTRVVLLIVAGAQAMVGAFVLGLAVKIGTSGAGGGDRADPPSVLVEAPVPPGPFPLVPDGPVAGWTGGDLLVATPDGSLWSPSGNRQDGITFSRIDLSGTITRFPAPSAIDPRGLTAGPDAAIWFADLGGAAIGRLSAQGKVTLFPIGSKGYPTAVASGSDGNLWFTVEERGTGDWIGRMSTSGTVSRFPLPTTDGRPEAIIAGPDGNLWFSMHNAIGRVTPAGAITEMALATTLGVPTIVAGPHGEVWFATDVIDGGAIVGRVVPGPVPRIAAVYDLPAHADLGGIVAATDGNLWVVERSIRAVARITPGGQITRYSLGPDQFPFGMAATSDGTIWLTIGPARPGLYRFSVPR